MIGVLAVLQHICMWWGSNKYWCHMVVRTLSSNRHTGLLLRLRSTFWQGQQNNPLSIWFSKANFVLAWWDLLLRGSVWIGSSAVGASVMHETLKNNTIWRVLRYSTIIILFTVSFGKCFFFSKTEPSVLKPTRYCGGKKTSRFIDGEGSVGTVMGEFNPNKMNW